MKGTVIEPVNEVENDGAASADAPARAGGRRQLPDRVRTLLEIEVVRFGLVGVVNTAFGYGLFIVLELTVGHVLHYLVILGISHVLGVIEAYLLQRWLVFRARGHWWRDLMRFWSVYLVALGFNAAALPFLHEVMGVAVIPAQGIVLLVSALGTYVAHRNFSFRRPSGATLAETTEERSSHEGAAGDVA